MRLLIYVLAGIAVAALVAWWINRKKRLEQQAARERDATRVSVSNDVTGVGRGGVLRLPPFGRQAAPVETYVKHVHRYVDQARRPWYELVCDQAGRDLLVEWERDGSKVFVTAGYEDENPTLEDLRLTEDDLIRFDEEQQGTLRWDGLEWTFELARETELFEDDGQEREAFYRWSFHGPGDERWLTVEKWEGDNRFYVYHQWRVDPQRIEVFDAGEARR